MSNIPNPINTIPLQSASRTSSTSALSGSTPNPFYNQQMLLQQQYMQGLPSLYSAQQSGGIMLQPHQMDLQTFQQQQHIIQVMQQQQQQQVLQNQQRSLSLHESQSLVQQQAVIQQQQQYQRALQQAAQHQAQQQRQLEQQRLMEQQQRQLDRMHQEREAQLLQQQQDELLRQKTEALARQQQEEAARLQQEELRRIAYQKELQLRQKREAQEKLQLEQQKIKEEQKKQEEAKRLDEQRKEMEKVMAIREEQNRKQREAREAFNAMKEKADSFPIQLNLAGCHTLTKLVSQLPFPSLYLPYTSNLKVETVGAPNSEANPEIVAHVAEAVAQTDVAEIVLKHDEDETNEVDLTNAPAVVRSVLEINSHAFDVDFGMDTKEVVPEQSVAPIPAPGSAVTEPDGSISIREEPVPEVMAPSSADGSGSARTSQTEENCGVNSVESKSESLGPAEVGTPLEDAPKPNLLKDMKDEEQNQLRRQIVSLGKQPKAHQVRKKKDMVESLYDSLTGYFDPSEGRRRRQRTRTFEEEQNERVQLELIAQMEKAESEKESLTLKSEHRPDHAGTSSECGDEAEKPKFFDEHKRGRKRNRESSPEQLERPPTPSEIIQQRELEWRERQRKKREKLKRRLNDSESECWNSEVMAEQESYAKFTSIIDQIFESIEDSDIVGNGDDDGEVNQDLLIDKEQLEELRLEAQKLKSWKKINKVNPDRLVKLLTILEKNIRDVIGADGSQSLIPLFDEEDDDESSDAYRELISDRIVRAADASCTAMIIMTSTKMPKQVFIEDTIDRSIQLCKQFLHSVIFPAYDGFYRTSSKRRSEDRRRKKSISHVRSRTVKNIYTRITELIVCFAELVRTQSLTDTAIFQLCSLGTGLFFVDNVGELQLQSIKLLSAVFSRYENFRKSIMQDLLNSIHRLPPMKTAKNSYRMSSDDWVSNLTVLIMQLVQSVVKVPRRHRNDENNQNADPFEETTLIDAIMKDTFADSQKIAVMFLSGFLAKCTAKSEEDYRRLFDQFLHDLLAAVYKPEWPAAEMLLTLLGNLLVNFYRSKNVDMSLRIASLDYLGTITASLRKDMPAACADVGRLDMAVKTLLYDELDPEEQTGDIDTIDISHMSGADKMKKVQRALIDYLIEKKGDADVSVEYAVMFYVGQWYKEIYDEGEVAKQRLKQARNSSELSDKEKRKYEKKTEKVLERCQSLKEFLLKTGDKRHMRKRAEHIARTGNVLMDSDAAWFVKYLASNREFSQSFSSYLKHILFGIHSEQAVGLRTKAMRCLTLIIDSDHSVLRIPEVHKAVHARMVDPNAAVREATVELIGKYVVAQPDFLTQYYPILIERIKDSGVAVRKRVIRIMREICERQPGFIMIPEMLARIVRRITDEEGVKKLTMDTLQTLLFQPSRERDSVELITKVITLTDMVQICVKENTVDFFEQMLNCLMRNADRMLQLAARQIVDALVDNVLTLDSKMASSGNNSSAEVGEENTSMNAAALHKEHQERLLACLTTLSLFSKAKPELMVKHAETLQPYLSMNMNGPSEQQVMNQVINMLERAVPLMEHPSDSLLKSLDESLCNLVKDGGMRIIASSIACIAAIHNKWRKNRPLIIDKFLSYLRFLKQLRDNMKQNVAIPQRKKPFILRSLYSIGLMSRYFDLDEILADDEQAKKQHLSTSTAIPVNGLNLEDSGASKSKQTSHFAEEIFQVLTTFCRYRDPAVRLKALNAIGNFSATHSEYLTRQELRNMYMTLLGFDDKDYLELKIQTLHNLEIFLGAEELKMVKNYSEWHKSKGEHDLKEMELANSGLASTIIQLYWNAVLTSYYDRVEAVRTAAAQVAILTLCQGLVTPGSSIPTLIAMSTDPLTKIRNKVEIVLKEIDSKYAGMVPSKAVSGIRCSFRLHRLLKNDPNVALRGIRCCESPTATGSLCKMSNSLPRMTNDGEALLSGLYQHLRTNRQQRRSFLSSVLRLFSEDCREKLSLEEWVFVADNVAMFPYQVMDEPLYVIRQIESIVSVSGQSIINNFMNHLLPRPNGLEEDEEIDFNPEIIYRRLPEEKTLLYDCMMNSQACFLLLYIKSFLMKLYAFSDAKVQEYSPSEAAKVYEKTLNSRKNIAMFNPQTALHELRPETAKQRETVAGHIEMSKHIVAFRNMLLSLDRTNEDDDDTEAHQTTSTLKESANEEEHEQMMMGSASDATALSENDMRL